MTIKKAPAENRVLKAKVEALEAKVEALKDENDNSTFELMKLQELMQCNAECD